MNVSWLRFSIVVGVVGICAPLAVGCVVREEDGPPPAYASSSDPGTNVATTAPDASVEGEPVAETEATEAPPAPQPETMPPRPAPNYIWIAGHWGWRGHWVWIGGHWQVGQAGHAWIGGHWERGPKGRYRWIPGHWG